MTETCLAERAVDHRPPVAPRLRVASLPGFGRHNLYVDQLYGALVPSGIAMVEELVPDPAWLRSRAGRLDAIHFHWPEKVWRHHVPAPLAALARSGIKGTWRLAKAAPGLRAITSAW